jgi:hypothetical protein
MAQRGLLKFGDDLARADLLTPLIDDFKEHCTKANPSTFDLATQAHLWTRPWLGWPFVEAFMLLGFFIYRIVSRAALTQSFKVVLSNQERIWSWYLR